MALVLSFIFSDSVRNTLVRQKAIRAAEKELAQLNKEADDTRDKISRLETNPSAYEIQVRKELGYLKPGEKEARFIDKTGKK